MPADHVRPEPPHLAEVVLDAVPPFGGVPVFLGEAPVRIAIEAGIRQGWDEVIGANGTFIGMTGFGASAPYKDLYKYFGFTAEAVVAAAMNKVAAKALAT